MNSDNYINELLNSGKVQAKAMHLELDAVVNTIAQWIHEQPDFHNPVYIIGGVASGKSTLANALAYKLGNSVVISTDDFVIETRDWRRTNIVAQNKSPLLKYDFDLLRQKIVDLGKTPFDTVLLSKYDEFSGLAVADSPEQYLKIETKPDYVIIEGDFQVYPHPGLQIYLHLNDQARTDNRVARDSEKRNETDISKLLADIKTRNEQQHFPFTLPNAESSQILLSAEQGSDGKYKYSLYKNINYDRKS